MAAGGIANKGQLDRHKINRSGVVIKYVGETEKRLNKIFLKAGPNNLMLFLDGADVLLGKRSTVKDARDRYGNSEKGRSCRTRLKLTGPLVNLP